MERNNAASGLAVVGAIFRRIVFAKRCNRMDGIKNRPGTLLHEHLSGVQNGTQGLSAAQQYDTETIRDLTDREQDRTRFDTVCNLG